MEDRYFDIHESVKRLVNDYVNHGTLYIAFDFDNTIYDYHKKGDVYPKVKKLLQYLSSNDSFKLILFTSNEGQALNDTVIRCKAMSIYPDFINYSPLMDTRKPYYNILLDDRAGLYDAYLVLTFTLTILKFNYDN